MKLILGYQNTKGKEDIALTPYLFGVNTKYDSAQIYGIGMCWLYTSVHISLAFGLNKSIVGSIKRDGTHTIVI